jgi:serine carboxypeptidase-like clade 2
LFSLISSIFCGTPITNLPDYHGPPITQSSGYITVDQAHGRRLFYWLVESSSPTPDKDPLVFWYQGGPGCSGLGGLFMENGPFVPDEKGGIRESPFSWNRLANVVYLEQPAGVGFSYSDTPSDYNTDDLKAAEDNFRFIEGFLKENPKFIGRDIWLTGESYAGVYIPTLTRQILNHVHSQSYSQLRGFLAGNPVFSCESVDYNAVQFDMFYWHALVSYTNYANWTKHGCDKNSAQSICDSIMNTAVNEIGIIDQELKRNQATQQPSLDPDDLFQDFCLGNGTLEWISSSTSDCTPLGIQTTNYLNRADVQQAIHAKHATWSECANINYTISGASMIPLYRSFFKERPDLHLLVYSGDLDVATVPFGNTKPCLAELRPDVKAIDAWQPWFVNDWTAGYVESFDRYTFATMKGAGHEAPMYQPRIGFEMFKRWVTEQNLTRENTLPKTRTRWPLQSQGHRLRTLLKTIHKRGSGH